MAWGPATNTQLRHKLSQLLSVIVIKSPFHSRQMCSNAPRTCLLGGDDCCFPIEKHIQLVHILSGDSSFYLNFVVGYAHDRWFVYIVYTVYRYVCVCVYIRECCCHLVLITVWMPYVSQSSVKLMRDKWEVEYASVNVVQLKEKLMASYITKEMWAYINWHATTASLIHGASCYAI